MKLISLLYADWMNEDDIAQHQHSDRIWLPSHLFQRWILEEESGSVIIADLGGVGVCVYGPHRGPGNLIYAPNWICERLKVSGNPYTDESDDDYITPIRKMPPQCRFVKVQPYTSTHIRSAKETEQPAEDVLARGFERYTCIQKGTTLQLLLESGEPLDVEILETIPEEGLLCIRAGEIELELLPPLDIIASFEETLSEPLQLPLSEPTPLSEPISENTYQETREERRKRLADAAMARFNKTQN